MNNLFIVNEIFTNKYNIEALDILSIFIIICGIYIIISKNPIVSILFLFILMLINIRISELQNNNKNSIPLALIISILLNYSVFQILPYSTAVINNYFRNINSVLYNVSLHKDSKNFLNKDFSTSTNSNDLYFASSNDWNGNIIDINNISNIGNIMYTSYNLWLILTSFILLLAMVGAIVITIKK